MCIVSAPGGVVCKGVKGVVPELCTSESARTNGRAGGDHKTVTLRLHIQRPRGSRSISSINVDT